MLILIEQNVADDAEKLSPKEVEHLDDILFYHAKFYHYVAASKRTAINLVSKLEGRLSERGIQTLKNISTQSNDLANIVRQLKFYAVIRRSHLAGSILEKDGEFAKWICDLQFAAKWFSHPSSIIGEHLVDTRLFRVAGIDFASSIAIDSRMQKFSSEMSGGSGNAPSVMDHRLKEGSRPVLCVLDSDKFSPSSANSDSVVKCLAVIDNMGGVAHFFALGERELENLIPTPLLKGAVSELPVSVDRDVIFQKLELLKSLRTKEPQVYSYVDLKEGTCMTWAKKNNVAPFFSSVQIMAPCSCCRDCLGFVALPLFKEVLAKTVDFAERQSPKSLRDLLKDEPRSSWLELGKAVFSFSLSNNVRTT